MLSVLEAEIFQYGFPEEHKVCENNRYWSSICNVEKRSRDYGD